LAVASSVLLPALRSLFTDADVASLVGLRRDLHQHPELSWKEQRTAARLAEVVTARAGGIRLDTLFIDEGFGSLDAASLGKWGYGV
jgi:metal-dependent amidase/aminoacylase/carboxypeptidase family protein